MEKIKNFIVNFFEVEAETFLRRRFPALDVYNKQLDKMNSFCIEEIQNTFGLVKEIELSDNSFYEKWSNKPAPLPRHLFKISEYNNQKYGKLFLVYCSNSNPYDDYFSYFHCFVVALVNNEMKIVRKFTFDDDSRMLNYKIWIASTGYKDITFETLGDFVKTERYLEPVDCELSMVDYKEDK